MAVDRAEDERFIMKRVIPLPPRNGWILTPSAALSLPKVTTNRDPGTARPASLVRAVAVLPVAQRLPAEGFA